MPTFGSERDRGQPGRARHHDPGQAPRPGRGMCCYGLLFVAFRNCLRGCAPWVGWTSLLASAGVKLLLGLVCSPPGTAGNVKEGSDHESQAEKAPVSGACWRRASSCWPWPFCWTAGCPTPWAECSAAWAPACWPWSGSTLLNLRHEAEASRRGPAARHRTSETSGTWPSGTGPRPCPARRSSGASWRRRGFPSAWTRRCGCPWPPPACSWPNPCWSCISWSAMSGRCKERCRGEEAVAYLLMIAAGLPLCAVSIRFFQRLPQARLCPDGGGRLRAGGGGTLGSLLCRGIQIHDPVLVQADKAQHDERNTMICEKAAARAARIMQGTRLYFGMAYARFLDLPAWITWSALCLAWGLLEWGFTL